MAISTTIPTMLGYAPDQTAQDPSNHIGPSPVGPSCVWAIPEADFSRLRPSNQITPNDA